MAHRALHLALALVMVGGQWGAPARAAEVPDGVRIIGVGVNCPDVPYNNRANGTDLWMYDCNSTPAQAWSYNHANGNIRLIGTNKCLDIEGPRPGNGVPVQIWDCQNVPQHRWSVTALGQIKTFDGRCLDVRGGGTANENQLYCHAVASAFGGRAARDVIGPTWDLENEDINTVDFCNDIPIPN